MKCSPAALPSQDWVADVCHNLGEVHIHTHTDTYANATSSIINQLFSALGVFQMQGSVGT